MNLDDPTTAALAASEALARAGLPHALYGGLVLAGLGEPRETSDSNSNPAKPTEECSEAARHIESLLAEQRLPPPTHSSSGTPS